MLKHHFLKIQSLKTHFYYFNGQVNNLDDMERKQLFYGHPAIFWKIEKVGC